ncbi:MAG: hypothetical protein U5O16_40685 [Rhodococcus sp. (in: high G+C Gram-positive bacteria)]|uniref:hypothetical protein n=1 Tax=Rhodococcus sp. TaxID=1831 RepID=UPI002AD8D00B|nr:hypothetical protein [Rhodococcus sp. (in: high G+C Gram-positive bacteria)]
MVALVPKKVDSDVDTSSPRRRRSVSLGTAALFVPLGVILLITLIGPWIVPFDPTKVVGPPSLSPDSEFWLGTDSNGLDVFRAPSPVPASMSRSRSRSRSPPPWAGS